MTVATWFVIIVWGGPALAGVLLFILAESRKRPNAQRAVAITAPKCEQVVLKVPKHKRRFQTGSDGSLPAGIHLLPHSTYALAPVVPETASPIGSVNDLINWVRECVLGDLKTLKDALLRRQESALHGGGGGNFLLAVGCTMAIEYLARSSFGCESAQDDVQKYLKHFFRPIDERYGQVGVLMWVALRNGIVHGSWPQSVCLQRDRSDRIPVGVSALQSDPHLQLVMQDNREIFAVNAIQLFDDLNRSFEDQFVPWLNQLGDATSVLDRGGARLLAVREGNDQLKQGFQFIVASRNVGGMKLQ